MQQHLNLLEKKYKVGEMSTLAILTKCPLAKCPLAKCPLAKCRLAKCPLAKCHGFVPPWPMCATIQGQSIPFEVDSQSLKRVGHEGKLVA